MPLVKIHVVKGKSAKYLQAISEGVHTALVETASVPRDDRFHIVTEHAASHMIADPHYANAHRSTKRVIIEIIFNVGRTLEIKKQLYAAIVKNLGENPKIPSDDVMISLVEIPRENWSFAHGLATYAP